jgi:hypothetical protein
VLHASSEGSIGTSGGDCEVTPEGLSMHTHHEEGDMPRRTH